MNIKLKMHRNIGNGDKLGSYHRAFSWVETDDAITGGWVSSFPGPVEDDITFHHMVCRSEREAVQAILDAVGHQCDVIQVQSQMDSEDDGSIFVVKHQNKHKNVEYHNVFLLGRRGRTGDWLSGDLSS